RLVVEPPAYDRAELARAAAPCARDPTRCARQGSAIGRRSRPKSSAGEPDTAIHGRHSPFSCADWSNAAHFPRKPVNDQEINGFGLDGAEILRVHSEREWPCAIRRIPPIVGRTAGLSSNALMP